MNTALFFLIVIAVLIMNLLIEGGILVLLGKIFKTQLRYKDSLKIVIIFTLLAIPLSALIKFIFDLFYLKESGDLAGIMAIVLLIIIMPFIWRHYAKSSWKLGLIVFFSFVFLSAFVTPFFTLPIREWVISPYVAGGNGMSPTIKEGSYFWIKKWDRKFLRGDVVVFKNPKKSDQDMTGRIIGLPNEKIQIQEGKIFINEKILEEPYEEEKTEGNVLLNLKNDEYFILEDNRKNNLDSRSYGAVKRDLLKGKVIYVIDMKNILD